MKNSLKILTKISAYLQKFSKYRMLTYFVVLLLLYSFLVFKINVYNNSTPTDDQLTTKLKTTTRPHIDDTAKNKVLQLQDNSSEVKTLFETSRNSPFYECLDKHGNPTSPPNCT